MNIIVYTSSTCPWCVKAKNYLKSRGFKYQEINISQNPQALTEMVKKSGQRGVPVIDIDGNIVVGFNRAEIDRLLNQK